MKRVMMAAAIAGMVGAAPALAADEDMTVLMGEAKTLIESFSGTLKGELMAAIKAGGPVNAIGVCNDKAPQIALDAPTDPAWTIGRSSHKLRSPDNAADAFTAAAIEDFVAREAAGEAPDTLVTAEIVEQDGARMFRMVKAIPTGEACLNCHGGDEVTAEVVAKLAELYPADQARGFQKGQMRGVFTLTKVLD
jgi:cytochrome c1